MLASPARAGLMYRQHPIRVHGDESHDLPCGSTAFHQWHPSQDPPINHLEAIVSNACRFHAKWDKWPMKGWLADFADAGLVSWTDSTLELAAGRQ